MKPTLQDPSAWGRISQYLDRVLHLAPDERESWLGELAKTRPTLANGLRKLIEERDELNARGFLENSPVVENEVASLQPALLEIAQRWAGRETSDFLQEMASPGTATPRNLAGTLVGPYRLLREIGHGGMSSVWLAERSDGQMKRQVALKLPHMGHRDLQPAERFTRERDILAALSHSNIARLYDAGLSESGQPYLAMEYVSGSTLDSHCDTACLPIRERLRVFLQVLEAVQFAHSQLIIHRDLKPSNILATPQGRVMLLDFGVAKLLRDTASQDHLTRFAGRMLTLEYASPEQISGEGLGIGSDIYSLGVVLYELLCGERPYRLKRESAASLEEAILTQEPLRPSHVSISEFSAHARGTIAGKLRRALAGDLDTIALKALKKHPNERYLSIDAFKQDIVNHLNRVPVSARPDSRWYHFSRFVSRHRIPVGGGTLALLAIVASAVVAARQAGEASRERDRALALAQRNTAVTEFLGAVITEAAGSHKPITVGDMLARSERLALADTRGDHENRAAVLAMIAEQYQSLGSTKKATQLLGRALALLGSSQRSELRSQLTCQQAVLTSAGRKELALRVISDEIEQLHSAPRSEAECLLYRAYISGNSGDTAAGLRDAKQALDRLLQAGHVPIAIEALFLGALGHSYQLDGQNRQADEYFARSLREYAAVGRDRSPDALVVRSNWAVASGAAGTPRRALALYDEALAILAERDPGGSPPAYVVHNRARSLHLLGRFAESRAAFEWGLQLAIRQESHEFQGYCLLGLASVAADLHDRTGAAMYLQRFEELPDTVTGEKSSLWPVQMLVHGKLDIEAGAFEAALIDFDRALRRSSGPNAFTAQLGKAEAELLAGNASGAASNAQLALGMATSLQGGVPYSNRTGLAWLMLGRALREGGKSVEAHAAFEVATRHLSNTVDTGHPALLEARRLLTTAI